MGFSPAHVRMMIRPDEGSQHHRLAGRPDLEVINERDRRKLIIPSQGFALSHLGRRNRRYPRGTASDEHWYKRLGDDRALGLGLMVQLNSPVKQISDVRRFKRLIFSRCIVRMLFWISILSRDTQTLGQLSPSATPFCL